MLWRKKCALRVRSQQLILDGEVRNGVPPGTAPSAGMAAPDAGQAEWGHQDFRNRDKHAQRHRSRKHFGKEKPLLEVQNRGNIEGGVGCEMKLRFLESVEGCERKVRFSFWIKWEDSSLLNRWATSFNVYIQLRHCLEHGLEESRLRSGNQLGGHWVSQAKNEGDLANDGGCRKREKRMESRHICR